MLIKASESADRTCDVRTDRTEHERSREYDEEVSGYYGTLPWWGL